MKKTRGLILFVFLESLFLFTAPLAMAFNDDTFQETEEPESIEELSSKIKISLPNATPEYTKDLAEAIYLMRELKREIYLTRKLITLREEGDRGEEIPPLAKKEVAQREGPHEARSPEMSDFIERLTGGKTHGEILLAKYVSEEGGTMGEAILTPAGGGEEKGKIISPVPPAPIPQRLQVYSKDELRKDMTSVVIEMEQRLLIPAMGLKRFMITDPKILQARSIGDKVEITAVGLGKTFLHIWDVEGRRTIKITVTQKGYEKFTEARKQAFEEAKMDSFKVRYSYDRYRLDSDSKNAARQYMYDEYFHRLNITGETPWGMASSRLQYEGRNPTGDAEETSDLTAWDFNLRGEDIEASLGDVGAYFSDITLPQTSFQGLRFKNPDKKEINYDLVWGARGNRMWGYRVLEWDTANYFYGARGQVEPADFIRLNATLLRATEYDDEAANYTYASGMGLNFFDDALEIEAEAARNESALSEQHNHAYKIESTLRLKDYNLTLEGEYRDIDPDFLLVTGTTAPNIGHLGYFFDADYRPFKYLRLTGGYDVYRNRYSFNAAETQRYNYDWSGTVDFNMGTATTFKYAIWSRIREGEATPARGNGELYQVSHNLLLPTPFRSISLDFRYEPNKYKSLGDPTPNYRERKYTAGMRMNVVKNLYYDLSHEWYYRKMTNDAEHGMVKSLATGISYTTQILDTPFYGSVNFRYEKEYGFIDNIRITTGENTVTGQGEIKYRPSPEFETYLRVNYKHIRGVLDHGQSREEARIYGGGSYFFDTTLRWGIGGSIKGYLFKDLNGNGEKDEGEEGLSGVNIYAGEDYSAVTNADGKFEFRNVKGYEISVMYDTEMVPEGYKSTTPNPQKLELARGYVSEVNFGILAVAEIGGMVFNDVNMNGIFDANDEGVKEVLLTLDDGAMAQTMATGHYRLEEVKPGKKILGLDTITLPPNLVPLTTAKRAIDVTEGKTYEENFPLYALRTIVGTVFIDENGNNRFDAEEKGVPDVVLQCADFRTLTDSNGRYFLKKLPGGVQEVTLDTESIPSGYELSVEPSRTVELLLEGGIKEDVNFPVKRREE